MKFAKVKNVVVYKLSLLEKDGIEQAHVNGYQIGEIKKSGKGFIAHFWPNQSFFLSDKLEECRSFMGSSYIKLLTSILV